ncbi:MAG: hypothetical protein ACR2K1_15760, partial [Saprospiraceae bacterium]
MDKRRVGVLHIAEFQSGRRQNLCKTIHIQILPAGHALVELDDILIARGAFQHEQFGAFCDHFVVLH